MFATPAKDSEVDLSYEISQVLDVFSAFALDIKSQMMLYTSVRVHGVTVCVRVDVHLSFECACVDATTHFCGHFLTDRNVSELTHDDSDGVLLILCLSAHRIQLSETIFGTLFC